MNPGITVLISLWSRYVEEIEKPFETGNPIIT
jgi:hypothetical protein